MNVRDVLKLRPRGREDTPARTHLLELGREALAGQRVLVTGAGGSIGSELSRAVARSPAAKLVVLDRDDSALHALRLDLDAAGPGPEVAYYLRDLCDEDELDDVFQREKPQVVLHAAALKHVPVLEENPSEAYRVNVLGTRAALSAAARCGTDVFVNVSTDKASNPSSVLGLSKRLAECITAHFSTVHEGRYVSVRFGNVLGSRGSFLPLFVDRIANRQPIAITHEEATRFLMTMEDAVELVLLAIAGGRSGETLIADMGDPVRIIDIAHSLISQSGCGLPIEIVGLRPGDKLHEDYLDDSESPAAESVSTGATKVRVTPVDPDLLDLDRFLKSVEELRGPVRG